MKKKSKNSKELSKKLEDLNDWYGRQPFDNVLKITGIDLFDYPEVDEMEENDQMCSRDEAIDEAKEKWNELSLEEKETFRKQIGDSW